MTQRDRSDSRRADDLDAARGLLFGLTLCVAIWAVVAALAILLIR